MTFHSQVGQDEWVHSMLRSKRNGFFVELGACDGLYLSNTLFFERSMGWKGVLIEPNDNYFAQLQRNRTCHTCNDLVFSKEGERVQFAHDDAVSAIINQDMGPWTRTSNVTIKTTNTLGNILDRYGAPSVIDYLSLDVEGQEYEILKTFPFDKYAFRCMTVEHNAPHQGDAMQKKIRDVLERNGYIFVKGNDDVRHWGHGPIDDFYIHPLHIRS